MVIRFPTSLSRIYAFATKSTRRQRACASNDRCFQFAEGLPDLRLETPRGWPRRTESRAFGPLLSAQRIYYVFSQRQSTIRMHEYHKPENGHCQCLRAHFLRELFVLTANWWFPAWAREAPRF